MTSLLKKLKVINIDQNSHSQTAMVSVWSVSKLSTESVGSRRERVANSVHTPNADATQLRDSTRQLSRVGDSASAVYIGHYALNA